ncbi:MAG: gamma-aminobutyrate permease [Gammaproteobacteria bacterium]|jgi:lysine-specific permease|nr:gamma-aminobutyrate permease [Gammaproteobacteria bacterium]
MSESTLRRHLSSRHIIMIAIGGSIGTGIFFASGNAIHTAGPGGAILAYLLIAIMVYFLMTSLGEMSALLPNTGSFCDYSTRFVEPAFGFAMSYNYWFNWAITVAVDLSSASFVMSYWFPHVSFIVWSLLFFAMVIGLNILTVKSYGESQYWLSIIKVITVILFLIVGTLIIFGAFHHTPIDLKNWRIGDAPFHNGWTGFAAVLLVAGFSFQGTELFGVTAGEAHDPHLSIPKAVRSVFWRILIFYIGAIAIISFIIPYTDPSLVNTDTNNLALSPFTIIFRQAGLQFAASLVNLVILSAVLSACTASMYTATRILWHTATEGNAPRIFSKLTSHGIPLNALIATAAIGSLVFLSSFFGNGKVFIWLINISSLSGFIAWIGIAICHYRFRRAYLAQGKSLQDLPYQSKYFPFAPLFALGLCLAILLGQQFVMPIQHPFNWGGFIGTYIGIPIFLILYVGYKYYKKSKLIPLTACQF